MNHMGLCDKAPHKGGCRISKVARTFWCICAQPRSRLRQVEGLHRVHAFSSSLLASRQLCARRDNIARHKHGVHSSLSRGRHAYIEAALQNPDDRWWLTWSCHNGSECRPSSDMADNVLHDTPARKCGHKRVSSYISCRNSVLDRRRQIVAFC